MAAFGGIGFCCCGDNPEEQTCSTLILPWAWTVVVPEFPSSTGDPCADVFLPGSHDLFRNDYIARYESTGTCQFVFVPAAQACLFSKIDIEAKLFNLPANVTLANPCASPTGTRNAYQAPCSIWDDSDDSCINGYYDGTYNRGEPHVNIGTAGGQLILELQGKKVVPGSNDPDTSFRAEYRSSGITNYSTAGPVVMSGVVGNPASAPPNVTVEAAAIPLP